MSMFSLRHIVLRNIAGLERYFSVREKHGVKENSIGLGKKQREWAGVQIADRVIGITLVSSWRATCSFLIFILSPTHPALLPLLLQ